MKINLYVVLDAIEMADDNYTYFLDKETGESVFLADELITGLNNEGLEDEIEENPDRYLRLPTKFEIHDYHIMEEYVWSLPEGKAQNMLERAIQGRGAFRRFKDTLDELGLKEKWYQFEADTYKKMAVEWCKDNGIEYYEDKKG